ncbi:MAG: HD domain-containing protein [Thermoprotei archaeon]
MRFAASGSGQQGNSGKVKVGDIPAYPTIGEYISAKEVIIKEGLSVLRKAGANSAVVAHCFVTSFVAYELVKSAKALGLSVDEDLTVKAALLHDVGRAFTRGVLHAVKGAEYLAGLGYQRELLLAVERHVGAGITEDQAAQLGLPKRDYVPQTLEEKIVSFADKLVEGTSILGPDHVLARFEREFGKNSQQLEMAKKLIDDMRNIYERSSVPALLGWKSNEKLELYL